MFNTERRRLGQLSRRGQGFAFVIIGVLNVAPAFLPGEFRWWRLALGGPVVLFGVYGIIAAGRSKDEP